MAIFKPETKKVNYFGVCNIGIVSVEDKSSMYKWADVYLNIVCKQEGSEYTRNLQIAGSFDRDVNGDIKECSLLRKVYAFFNGLGETAGINISGGWEREDGTAIEDIAEYLTAKYGNAEPDTDLIAYIYKETPKQDGGTAYTRVYHLVYSDSEDNRKKLQEEIDWRREKGYIKVYDESKALAGDVDADSVADIPL